MTEGEEISTGIRQKYWVRTSVDQIASTLFEYLDGLGPRAADLLNNKLDILGVNTSFVNGALLLDSLKLGDVVFATSTRGLQARETRTSAARRELLGSRELRGRVHVLDLHKC